MQSILYLALEGFYVSVLKAADAELREKALVVHDMGVIIDSCDLAKEKKVHPGIPLSEAKSILREGGIYFPVEPDRYLKARNDWLKKCLIASHVIEPESHSSAWIDLSGHPDPLDVATSLFAQLVLNGYMFSAGVATSKWVAKLSAQKIDVDAARLGIPQIEPVVNPKQYLSVLPTQMLFPVSSQARDRLVFLGYRRIGKVLLAPISALKDQFGKETQLILQAAVGGPFEDVRAEYPPHSHSHQLQFESRVESRLELEAACEQIANQLSSQLCQLDRLAGHFMMSIDFEDGAVGTFAKALVKPIQAATPFRALLIAALDQIDVQAPVAGIRILLSNLKSAERHQRSLDHRMSKRDTEVLLQPVRSRLKTSFGSDSLQLASEMQVPRRIRLLRFWKHATGWH